MPEPELVETVFEVADKSTSTLAKIAKEGKETEKALDKARESAEALGRTSVGSAAQTKAEGRGHKGSGGPRVPFWMKALPEEERREFMEQRKEYQVRSARRRGQQLEMQREQAIHHTADIALLMAGTEESEFAKGLTKIGGMSQAVGTSMVGLGGKMGGFGKTLAELGGYAALAAVAFEGLSFIDEKTGHHIEHAGEAAWNWTQHLFGVSKTTADMEEAEEKSAEALGYRSAADMKAAEASEASARSQRLVTNDVMYRARFMHAMPADKNSAEADEAREEVNEAVRKTAYEMNLHGDQIEKLREMYTNAQEHSIAATLEHGQRTGELSQIEQAAAEKLSPLYDKDKESIHAHNEQVLEMVQTLLRNGEIYDEEAEAVTQGIQARFAANDTISTMITQWQEHANAEAQATAAVTKYSKMLSHHSAHETVETAMLRNAQIVRLAQTAAAKGEIPNTVEARKDFMSKLSTANQHFDFRGSRFDINQNFKDVDPDRVSVAFTRDLASIGEKRLQSSFAPLFSL